MNASMYRDIPCSLAGKYYLDVSALLDLIRIRLRQNCNLLIRANHSVIAPNNADNHFVIVPNHMVEKSKLGWFRKMLIMQKL